MSLASAGQCNCGHTDQLGQQGRIDYSLPSDFNKAYPMRLLFKLLLSAALGFAVVAVLVVVLPTPKSSSSFLEASGFFPEGKVTQLNA